MQRICSEITLFRHRIAGGSYDDDVPDTVRFDAVVALLLCTNALTEY